MGRKKPTSWCLILNMVKLKTDKTLRVFLFQSELDVWSYIEQEQIRFHQFTFHKRKVFLRDGMIWSHSPMYTKKKTKRLKNALFVF
jgi:sulfate adenylyltransferase subunit 2